MNIAFNAPRAQGRVPLRFHLLQAVVAGLKAREEGTGSSVARGGDAR